LGATRNVPGTPGVTWLRRGCDYVPGTRRVWLRVPAWSGLLPPTPPTQTSAARYSAQARPSCSSCLILKILFLFFAFFHHSSPYPLVKLCWALLAKQSLGLSLLERLLDNVSDATNAARQSDGILCLCITRKRSSVSSKCIAPT